MCTDQLVPVAPNFTSLEPGTELPPLTTVYESVCALAENAKEPSKTIVRIRDTITFVFILRVLSLVDAYGESYASTLLLLLLLLCIVNIIL